MRTFKEVLEALGVVDKLFNSHIYYLLDLINYTVADERRQSEKYKKFYQVHTDNFIRQHSAGKVFEAKLLRERPFLKDNTLDNVFDTDLICRNTGILVEAKADIVPLFSRKKVDRNFRKKTITFELQNGKRPGSMLRALMKNPKALVFKRIYEYEYETRERQKAYEDYSANREMRYPSTDDWIVGFKIAPLTKRLVDLLEDNDAEIVQIGNRTLLSVRFVDIMEQDMCVLYKDFTKEWLEKYAKE